MKKKHFAVVGHPIEHTMSPFIHKRLFELSGVDADYDIINIPPEDLSIAINSLKELDGFNVTIPHKQTIIPYLDGLSKKAALYKSVNVIKNDKRSIGYTTDPNGFVRALEVADVPLKGKVVILGAGGAARAAAYEAAMAGCETVIAVRHKSLKHVASLAGDIKTSIISPMIQTCTLDALSGDIDILINATPVGMYPKVHETLVSSDIVEKCNFILDMVYNPEETILLKIAKDKGVKCMNGIPMLVWQAVCAQNIWTGAFFDEDDVKQLYEDTQSKMKKIFSSR